MGKFGDDLKNLLTGIYPYDELNKNKTKDEWNDLLNLSTNALEFVSFWNRIVHKRWFESI
jgi:hypothetical protein